MPYGKPFGPGHDPRRSLGALTHAERAFKDALDAKHIPKASALLASVHAAAVKGLKTGDTRAAELFFKVCGLIKKPSNDEEMRRMVQVMFDEAIAEARRQRADSEAAGAGGQGEPKMIDVGTDED